MIGRRLVIGLLCMTTVLVVPLIGLPAGASGVTVQAVPGLVALADVWCRPDGTCLGVGETPARTGPSWSSAPRAWVPCSRCRGRGICRRSRACAATASQSAEEVAARRL